jgi:hypothetical protein
VGALTPEEQGRVVQSRTTGLQTLTAVIAVSYTLGKRQGTFDMVVNYAASGTLRFTAFKDTLLNTQVLFDLLLAERMYHLRVQEDAAVRTSQGPVEQFVTEHPTFRAFFVMGEAFFLPGFDSRGRPPTINAAGARFTTQLTSGATARWFARRDTLEITHACVTWPTEQGPVPLQLRYQDYRQMAGYDMPYHVTLRDRRLGFTAESAVKQMDINVPLPQDAFVMTPDAL